jgi:hypothetical protein
VYCLSIIQGKKEEVWTSSSYGCGSIPLENTMCGSYGTIHSPYKEKDTVITCYDYVWSRGLLVWISWNTGNTACANLEENTWLCRYPRPTQCIFENGSEFWGAEFANMLNAYMESNLFLLQQLRILLPIWWKEYTRQLSQCWIIYIMVVSLSIPTKVFKFSTGSFTCTVQLVFFANLKLPYVFRNHCDYCLILCF